MARNHDREYSSVSASDDTLTSPRHKRYKAAHDLLIIKIVIEIFYPVSVNELQVKQK